MEVNLNKLNALVEEPGKLRRFTISQTTLNLKISVPLYNLLKPKASQKSTKFSYLEVSIVTQRNTFLL